MTGFRVRYIALLLASLSVQGGVHAQARTTVDSDFYDAVVARHADEQIAYLIPFVQGKKAPGNQPAGPLIASFLQLYNGGARPPMDIEAMRFDQEGAAEASLSYAEFLYATGDFQRAARVFSGVSGTIVGARHRSRADALATKLALRGLGKMPAATAATQLDFNQILLLGQARTKPKDAAQAGQLRNDRLREKARESGAPAIEQHRALLWLAQEAGAQGNKDAAHDALNGIAGDSPLLPEALLAWMRADVATHPAALSAAAQEIRQRAPESVAVWEARERLAGKLAGAGARQQAIEVLADSVTTLGATLTQIDRQIAGLARLDAQGLRQLLPLVDSKHEKRVAALLARKQRMLDAAALLKVWRPHIAAYQERLRRGPTQFATEVRSMLEEANEGARRNREQNADLAGVFRLELGGVVGYPPGDEAAYTLFGGLAQWEYGAVYPRGWKPESAKPAEESRRRRRPGSPEPVSSASLAQALEHSKGLLAKTNAQLAKLPSFPYTGMAEQSGDLLARNANVVKKIEAVLPDIEQGIREELQAGLGERRRLAQLWLSRLAYLLDKQLAEDRNQVAAVRFDLGQRANFRKGTPFVASLAEISSEPRPQPAGERALGGVLAAMQLLVESGETREMRASALRIRGGLVVSLYEAQAVKSVNDAVLHYRELLDEYGDLIDKADTTYQLARAQDLATKQDDSLATLTRFSREYDKDPRIGEVHFRIGELHFGFADYAKARNAYEQVLKKQDTRYADQAEYKLAWSLFKQGEHRNALPRFIAVIDRAADPAKNSDRLSQERLRDAFRAASLTFSYLDGAPDVERYFARAGKRPYVADIYAGLAGLYLERDRINDAAQSYDYLHKHYPNDARAPVLLAGIIQGARREGLSKVALEQQEHYLNRYAQSGSYWQQASPELRAEINGHMQPYLAEMAQMYHADAQQQKNTESRAKAIRYYSQYVATFPADKLSPRFNFLLAEARFESGDAAGALADYERAAYQYGNHDKAAESGYAALVARQKLVDQARGTEARKLALRELVTQGDRFAGTFAGDARVNPVLIKAGEDLLLLGEPAEAARISEVLLARKPEDSIRKRAILVLAHGYFESAVFDKAESAYAQALDIRPASPAQQSEINNRLGLSVYRQAEAQRSAGHAKVAIDNFLRVKKTAPGSDSIANAEIDASALLLESKRWSEAIDVLERFGKDFATHKLAADVPTRLAYAYENDGRFLKAADLLETISQTEQDDQLARQTLWRSAELRDKGERLDLAVATYERYLKRYPSPLEKASEVRQMLAGLATKAGDKPTRDRWLTEIISTHAKGGAEATVRVAYLAAQANMVFGDERAAEFDALKLKLPLDKSLAAKRKSLEATLKWYEGAGRYGIAEVTTAATFKTAELYRKLAGDLMSSDRPGNLNALEKEQYGILLEEEAFPFEDKATKLHELNHVRLRENIYDDWVKASLTALATLLPSRYERTERTESYFHYEPPKPTVKEGEGAKTEGKPDEKTKSK